MLRAAQQNKMRNMDVATYTEILMINVSFASSEHAVWTAEHILQTYVMHILSRSARERDVIAVAICVCAHAGSRTRSWPNDTK